jgi:hypothetical protein
MKITGVITGDIVASRELSIESRKTLYADLKKFMEELQKKKWVKAFEMFRGDSLQCVARNPEESLRVALMIRAFMKCYITAEHRLSLKEKEGKEKLSMKGYFQGKQDIRISIGIGGTDFIKAGSLAHSDGEAFHLSGEGLDGLKNTSYRIIVKTSFESFNEPLEPAILLLDAVIEKWTQHQAEITLFKLQDLKEEEIARKIGISQSAVSQRTKNSQWNAIEKLLHWFEKSTKVLLS